MTLPITGGPEWSAAQATPWFTVNEALRYLDAFAVKSIIQDRDLTAPPGSCADGARYLIAGSPTGLWSGQAGKLAIALGTNATNGWLFVTVAVEGTELWVRDEDVLIRYDGAAWVVVSSGTAVEAYRFGGFFTTTPDASEVLLIHVLPVDVTIPDNFAGSRGHIETNPTSSFVMDVQVNGSSIGTITVSTGGAFTFNTTGGDVAMVVGDRLKIVAPGTPDATAALASFTLVGEVQ